MANIATTQVAHALSVARDESIPRDDRITMLVEIATDLQIRPESPDQLHDAVRLYDHALQLLDHEDTVTRGRLRARQGSALHQIPSTNPKPLLKARAAFEEAVTLLTEAPELERAENEMNRGLVIQALASIGEARMTDAIAAYHIALRTFTRGEYPVEFAILHNNLATAYLSIPLTDSHQSMREALAVQSFEQALEVVDIVDHPNEYAMLQNNLGNALQYASSAHALANNLRAVQAYDQALRVRTREAGPLPYANTIANKANALRNLPDDPDQIHLGNPSNLASARALYLEAAEIFALHGATDRAEYAAEIAAEIASELASTSIEPRP